MKAMERMLPRSKPPWAGPAQPPSFASLVFFDTSILQGMSMVVTGPCV